MTHGVDRGLHGDWSGAVAAHPLAPVVTLVLVGRIVASVVFAIRPHLVPFERERRTCQWVNGGVVGACLVRYLVLVGLWLRPA
jgi:hypothetical protein